MIKLQDSFTISYTSNCEGNIYIFFHWIQIYGLYQIDYQGQEMATKNLYTLRTAVFVRHKCQQFYVSDKIINNSNNKVIILQ